MCPAAENSYSEGAEVATVASWNTDNSYWYVRMLGNPDSLSFHQNICFTYMHTFFMKIMKASTSSFIVLPLVSSTGPNKMSSYDLFTYFLFQVRNENYVDSINACALNVIHHCTIRICHFTIYVYHQPVFLY